MATITRTSDQEREQLRRSALSTNRSTPSLEEQSGGGFPFERMIGAFGSSEPDDPTNVSFKMRRRMRRDHMIAMGLHFIAMPLIKASWYYESEDARAAAFADNLIRPIYGRLIMTVLRMLWAGFSPAAKDFEVIQPKWVYYEDGQLKQVWTSQNVGALVYKPLIPLKPELCRPRWDGSGNFNGIKYDKRYGFLDGSFVINGTNKDEIDLVHSFWATHDQDGEDNCSPPDEQVLTTGGYVPISELDPDADRLVSFDPDGLRIHRFSKGPGNQGYPFQIGERPYSGEMLTVKTGVSETRVTPNHKFTVRWSPEAADYWAVYLMRRGAWWRIGSARLFNQRANGHYKNSGIGQRLQAEQADEAWVLGTFGSKRDALFHEALWSNVHGIPDLTFKSTPGQQLDDDDLARIWNALETALAARKLLASLGLSEKWPIYQRNPGGYRSRQTGPRNRWTCRAANLLPGLMEIPTDPGHGQASDWRSFTIERDHYEGSVFSLDVEPYHHYVSGDAVTQNSIYGYPRIAHAAPIFHLYWYVWTLLGRAIENNADPGPVMRYPRDDAPMFDADGDQIPNVKTALTLGTRRRSGSTVALPSDTYTDFQDRPSSVFKWGIEYPKADTDFDAIMNILGFLEAAKLRAIWIQEQGLIEGSGGQSNRNVATEFGQQRDASQAVLMQVIDDLIDKILVKPAMAMNMPQFEGTLRKKTIGLGQDDEDTIRQFFQLVGQADWKTFGVDARRLAEARGFPMLDPAEQQKQLEKAAEQAAQQPPPIVNPVDGRRAAVTQTGFNEAVYVQMGGSINLAEDGNFVAGLPKTVHFSDSAVLAATRLLRGQARIYYANLYADFARHVEKQRSLELDSPKADDWLADEEFASRLTDKLVSSWKPRAERALSFAAQVSRALGKIFDRTSSLQLKNSGSDQRINVGSDTDAAKWINNHGAELVTEITDSVRDELRDFMAREVKSGTTPKELGARLREEFTQWPAWKADRLARTETTSAFNYATLRAGQSIGIKKVQILDGTDDEPCRRRNGKILTMAEAFKEQLAHPNCTLGFRLLPRANLSVRKEPTDDSLLARFDEETDTILMSPSISLEDESKFLLAVGEYVTAGAA